MTAFWKFAIGFYVLLGAFVFARWLVGLVADVRRFRRIKAFGAPRWRGVDEFEATRLCGGPEHCDKCRGDADDIAADLERGRF